MSISRFRRILISALVVISLSVSVAGSTAPSALQFIKVAELHALLVCGTPPVLVDVRTHEEYAARHITGAVSIPLPEVGRRVSEIPRDRIVVLY
jgi:hypothetical protein